MNGFGEGPRESRRAFVTRLGLGVLVVGGFGLGIWGLSLYEPARTQPGLSWYTDLCYNALQLFVMGSEPLEGGGPYPWQLEVARFAAPVATVYAVVEAIWLVLGDRMARRRLRRRRNHTIVIGTTAVAQAIAEGLTLRSEKVVFASSGDPRTLAAHGIEGAKALYACGTEDADSGGNVATVLAAAAVRTDGGLRAYAHVASPALALALRARRLGLPAAEAMRLDFFNVDEVAARLVVESTRRNELDTSRVLVVGASTFAYSLLIELARHWRLRWSPQDPLPVVTFVDERASAAVADINTHWPMVRQVCRLEAVDAPVDRALAIGVESTPGTTYICCDDEELGLRTALSAAALWHGGRRSLVVRLNVMSRLGTAFATGHDDDHPGSAPRRDLTLLDDLGGRLLLVGVTEIASDALAMVEEDLVERLAQAIHDQYLLSQRAVAGKRETRPSLVEWADLDEGSKNANRAQAGDVGRKLSRIGCTVAPHFEDGAPFALTSEEVELLARLEHERWMEERTSAGWTRDSRRNDEDRKHPALRPWTDLPQVEREKNRDAVRALPDELASIGLRIVRLTPVASNGKAAKALTVPVS